MASFELSLKHDIIGSDKKWNLPYSEWENHNKRKKKVKYVYNNKITDDTLQYLYNKMSKKVEGLDIALYGKAFEQIKCVTNIAKYQDFQYRLLTGIIFANEKQTTKHMLYDCVKVQIIWKQVENYVKSMDNEFKISGYLSIFLNQTMNTKGHIFDFLISFCKQYIFACKCLGDTLNFDIMMVKFNEIQKMEKYKAVKQGLEKNHTRKWQPIML